MPVARAATGMTRSDWQSWTEAFGFGPLHQGPNGRPKLRPFKGVCTKNLNPDILVMKSTQDRT